MFDRIDIDAEDLAFLMLACFAATLLLTRAGEIEGASRDEDQLAFLRVENEYRNVTLVELPNGDFGQTVMRNFLFSAYQVALWQRLASSTDEELAAIAAKSGKESTYHLRHSADWVIRLGDGTGESRRRMQKALDTLWPYTNELFDTDQTEQDVAASGIGVAPADLKAQWWTTVQQTVEQACLQQPGESAFVSAGKRA